MRSVDGWAALVPTIGNSIFAEAVEAVTDRLDEAGNRVLLGLSGYPATREDDLTAAVLSRRPDAIPLTGINHSPETRRRLAAKVPGLRAAEAILARFNGKPVEKALDIGFEVIERAST